MEYKIGQVFEIDGIWYQFVEANRGICKGCVFYQSNIKCTNPDEDVRCSKWHREDGKGGHFVRLLPIGDVYEQGGSTWQQYKCIEKPNTEDKRVYIAYTDSEIGLIVSIRLTSSSDMEYKIGEIFEYNGEWYQCIGDDNKSCTSCDMNFDGKCPISVADCDGSFRSDNSDVCFKRLEKVGEPYADYCPSGRVIYFQRYKCYQKPIYNGDFICWSDDISISIEIKNKEDMEEKKPTYEELLHYYHSTVGLWAIDRSPQEVSLDWICDNAFQLGINKKDSNPENIGKNLKPLLIARNFWRIISR